jgi:signal transduction histidine kinase
MAIRSHSHRKQIFLFFVAVILPSIVLVAFTLRIVSQDRELAQKRALDERSRMAAEIGQHLLVRLEKIKLQETSADTNLTRSNTYTDYVNPEVVFTAQVIEEKLLMPWERDLEINKALKLLSSPNFMHNIQRAENEEYVKKNYPKAAKIYRQSMILAKETIQKGFARIQLARVLLKAGQKGESLSHYQEILTLPSNITDEYGVPLAFYAAKRLLEENSDKETVSKLILKELESKHWLAPTGSYLLKEITEILINTYPKMADSNTAKNIKQRIDRLINNLEQATALQNDFQGLELTASSKNKGQIDEPIWILYGSEPWMLSLSTTSSETQSLIIAVHAQKVFDSLSSEKSYPGRLELITDGSEKGESLGLNFRGIKVTFSDSEKTDLTKQWNVQRSIYILVLILVLGLTLFGAYLLWRDVRRDLRMAEMRSQFVSSVSHELKTPLTAIRMFAETLRLGRSKDKKTQEEYLDTIVNESERLTRLLNNVLDFSKIEKEKRIYKLEPTSLSEVIQAASRAMEYPLSQHGFKLNIQIEEGLPDVQADKDAIEQAVLNLLHNALKYSGKSRDIDLRLQQKDNNVVIKVIDRGVGIALQRQKRIFEKYYRVPSEEKERTTGTGLGLALVSHIVKGHNGHIEVQSEPGKGSTFSIYLPLEKKK